MTWLFKEGMVYSEETGETIADIRNEEAGSLLAAAPDLLEALEVALLYVEHGMPPAPNHYCGPDSPCDSLCVDFANASEFLRDARYAIAKAKGEQANA